MGNIASKIAAKLINQSEKTASKAVNLSESEAVKILDKYNTVESATKLVGPERKAYLEALDVVHGPQSKRAADLGFGDKTYYHGSTSDISAFDPEKQRHYVSGKGTYVTGNPNTASDYANIRMNYKESSPHIGDFRDGKITQAQLDEKLDGGGRVYPLKIKEGANYDFSYDPAGLKHENPDVMSQILKDSGFDSTTAYGDSGTKAIFKPENIRSTNAAFDPRFKKSGNILAGAAGLGLVGAATLGGNNSAEASPSSSIASKMINQGEKLATKGGATDAQQIIERLLPASASDAERAALRANPDNYKQYLNALDDAHGPKDVRAKDLGFNDETFYHGTKDRKYYTPGGDVNPNNTNSPLNIESFKPSVEKDRTNYGEGVYFSSDPKMANDYAGTASHTPSVVYPVRLKDGAVKSSAQAIPEKANITKAQPSDIRSTNAAFDPRFSDSADILALAGNQAPKIAARMIRPKMNLGDAFNSIAEPIAAIDKPVNELVNAGADKFAQLTDLKRGAGAGVDQNYEPIAKSAFNNFVGSVTPTPSSLMLGKGATLFKMAGSAPKIAEQMMVQNADKLAAQQTIKKAESTAAQNAVSQFASKDMDWTNLEHLPNELRPNMSKDSAAVQFAANKAKGKGVTVLDSKADQVGFGKVRVVP